MKHSMMRVAVAATLGLSALAANAGQIGVNVGATLAAEYMTDVAVVTQPTITYQTASLINDGAAVQVHVRFSAGDATAALPTANNVLLFLNGAAYNAANYTVTAVNADTDKLGYYFTLTAVATKGGIPAGAVININSLADAGGPPVVTAAKISKLSSALGAGGSVTTTVGYTTTVGDFSGVTTFVEAPSTATLLTSKKSLSQVVKNSNAVLASYYTTAEAKQVDVASNLKAFTGGSPVAGTAAINLGVTKLAIDATLKTPTGGNANIADFGAVTHTATGDFSAVAAAPGSVSLNSAQDCLPATNVAAGTISADKKSVEFASVAADLANKFLCYTTATTKAIAYNVQYAIGGAAVAADAGPVTIASTQTGGNVYFLTSNGASVVVPSFVPTTGALGAGYNTYLRVVNTGNLTADINVSAYNPTTGVAGTASKLASALPAGGSVVLSTDAVSTALGLTTGTWYSLLVTGSTSKLAVQPLLVNPQGVITNIGSVNGANNSAASN